MSAPRSAKWLRRYKAFRELEGRAAWLSERLEETSADLEQLKDDVEWERLGQKLAEQRAAN